MSDLISNIGDNNWETEVTKADSLVLVDFWAPWCGPCRALAPILDDLANSYSGSLKVVKYNIDDSSDMAARFSVSAVPTILLFKNGDVVDQTIGMVPKPKLEGIIKRHL